MFARAITVTAAVGLLGAFAGFRPLMAQQQAPVMPVVQSGTPIRDLDASHSLSCVEDHRDGAPLMVGAFLGDNVTTPTRVDSAMKSYTAAYGTDPSIMRFYSALDTPLGKTSNIGSSLSESVKNGSKAMLVIEPTWAKAPQKDLLTAIANGAADSLVAARVKELSSLKLGTVYIELASEMNGKFGALWQADSNGGKDAPAHYRDAWRRIVSVARKNGGANIKWVWAVVAGNAYTHDDSGDRNFNYANYWYPGDDVVDVIGLHAFNDPISQGAWIPFVELIDGAASDHSLSRLTGLHPSKPVMVTEFGTDEHPGKPGAKADWIREMFRQAEGCHSIVGLVWFDINKERDWRIASSPQSVAAFAAGAKNENTTNGKAN